MNSIECFETSYDLDKSLGMECYLTNSELFIKPSEKLGDKVFRVYELLDELGLASPRYIYGSEHNISYHYYNRPLYLYLLKKRNIDTFEAIRTLRKILGTREIIYLGLKDKAAETYQFIFVQESKYFIPYINKGSIELTFVALLPRRIKNNLKNLLIGNCFSINLRDITRDQNIILKEIMEKISEIGFLPNYYSYQRFGVERSITHILGKYLFQGDLENFFFTLICYPDNNCDLIERCRSIICEKKWMWVERITCRKLLDGENNYLKILSSIPREILRFYISAFISYIFNHYLSKRWKSRGLGYDVLNGELTQKTFFTDTKIPYLHFEIKRSNKLKIYSGYKEILYEILQRELSEHNAIWFSERVREVVGMNKIVMKRNLITPVYNLEIREWSEINFCLDKGGYASNLLREIFKSSIRELF